ncbi:AzlC family ABC transporter permease [Nocardioides zeae]|uniref:AzlC family ABC transporter permease n=1 Tax=Nocardioides imazamoxiresistens TaxID=3231893 RepID=A0ABU3PX74_9ACTN|nr:AzlC family ABC transporter permease [Nocardioides zeae]MDT9593829.1 AzlC family ABC transporter permease [Nocardioides zeae]
MPDPTVSEERRAVTRQGLAIGVATGLYGTSFGAVGVASGLSVAQTCALSFLVFTGASQFAFVGVLVAGGSPWSGAATGLMLGARNTLYGLGLAPRLQWRGWRRAGAAQVVIDESSAVATATSSTSAARVGFLVTGISVFVLWNAMTLVGALLGTALGDPRTYGLDAAVGAAFLALLWPRLTDRRTVAVAVAAALLALVLVPLTPAGVPVLAAASVALVAALLPAPSGAAGAAGTAEDVR